MNAKKSKILRKVARQASSGMPARQLVVGKKTMKLVWVSLSYEQAKRAGDELQRLIERDLVDGSAEAIRRDALADMMKQYMARIAELFTDEEIAAGGHKSHEPIPVSTLTARVTAINGPKTMRGIYLATKRMISRLQRKLGYEKIGVGLAPA
jgi:hypothetical protein